MNFRELIISSVKEMFTRRMLMLFFLLYLVSLPLNLDYSLVFLLSSIGLFGQTLGISMLSSVNVSTVIIPVFALSIISIFLSLIIRALIINDVSFIKNSRLSFRKVFEILKVSIFVLMIQSVALLLLFKESFISDTLSKLIYAFLLSAQNFQIPSLIFPNMSVQLCLLGIGECFSSLQQIILTLGFLGPVLVMMISILTIFSFQGIVFENRTVIDSLRNSIITVKENPIDILVLWILSGISYAFIIAIGSVITIILYEVNILMTMIFFLFSTFAIIFVLILQTRYYIEKKQIDS